MNKGLNMQFHRCLMVLAMLGGVLSIGLFCGIVQAQVYKVVDADGNVTYTDQAPSDDAAPMVLPELSVVDTDYVAETQPVEGEDAATSDDAAGEAAPPTPREMRKMFRDFRITRPTQEETFWGTANTVVISWASSTPLFPDMSVRVFVDGENQANAQNGMSAVTLDRGEHQVYAELLDGRGRRVVTTATVTFFVKQSVSNRPVVTPHRGN